MSKEQTTIYDFTFEAELCDGKRRTTKEQRQILKGIIDTINKKTFCKNYHVIRPTIEFQSTDVSFVAYDDLGDMKYFYINFEHGYANSCNVHIPTTNECIECNINISDWFFN